MNIKRDISNRTFEGVKYDDLFDDLVKEIEMSNYRVTRIYDIDNIKGQEDLINDDFSVDYQHYKIIEFCNLVTCADLISTSALVGAFFPLKFIIYQSIGQDKINIAFLKPSAIATLFDSDSMAKASELMEKDMLHILEEIDF